ncbi:unnamed protein product [Heterobilharzia americana]|nr:unnamed protein product [Heterobilharzia americana]
MDPVHFFNEFHRLNLTTRISNYGYIYYAGLYSSNSFFIEILVWLVCVGGVFSNVLLFLGHVCAILYGRRHLYQVPYPVNLQKVYKYPLYRRCIHRLYSIVCKWPLSSIISQVVSCIQCLLLCDKCKSNKTTTTVTKVAKTTPTVTNTTSQSTHIPLPSDSSINHILSSNDNKNNHNKNTNVMIDLKSEVLWPGVTILKPLSGKDPNLEMNLLSFFQLDYPTYELLFCISDKDDPACEIVEKLITQYPHIDAQLILAKDMFGINPKIINLQAGYEASKYSLLLISDSGLWMRSDTLTDMVSSLEVDPKLV